MVEVQAELNEQKAQQIQKTLASLLVSNPETRNRLKKLIRNEIKNVAKNLRRDVRQVMQEDPRKAYRAIKSTVYRRILGANVSILNPRKAGARYMLVRDRKLDQNPNQRGGNRVTRSERTNQVDSYFGRDRAFILRFLNSGTSDRMAGSRGGRLSGNRGSIAARNWFDRMASWQMDAAADNLGKLIEDEMAAVFGENYKD
jgi:hypothetical protein